MPPKGRPSNAANVSEDIVEALLDPRILEQLGDALGGRISSIVEAKLDAKLEALLGDYQKLKEESAQNSRAIASLETKVKSQRRKCYSSFENRRNRIIFKRGKSHYLRSERNKLCRS